MGRKFIFMISIISGLLFFLSITGELQAQVDWCSIAQGDAQQTVTAGGPYKNHGQRVKTAAQAANPYLYDGRITEECHSCIVNQFARGIPIEEQEPCVSECPVYDLCVEGEPGDPPDPACDTCVASVCEEDSYCCETRWDEMCVREAFEICDIYCPEAFCWADSCGTMAPAGCGCDPDCCTRGDCCPDAESECGISCPECAHGLCLAGEELDPACDPCVAAVCEIDEFCCDGGWDGICIDEAVEICDDFYCPALTCSWFSACDIGMAPAGCGCDMACCIRQDCCPDTYECGFECTYPVP